MEEDVYKSIEGGFSEDDNSEIIQILHQRLVQKIKENTGLTMKVKIKNPGSVPGSEGGKLNRVMDNRKIG